MDIIMEMKYKLLDEQTRTDLKTNSRYDSIELNELHRSKGIIRIYEDKDTKAKEACSLTPYVIIANVHIADDEYATIIDKVDTTELAIKDGGLLKNYLMIESNDSQRNE